MQLVCPVTTSINYHTAEQDLVWKAHRLFLSSLFEVAQLGCNYVCVHTRTGPSFPDFSIHTEWMALMFE